MKKGVRSIFHSPFFPFRGLTLIELMIAIILMGMLVLGFYSIDLFSRYHVISSDKRAKLQNEISYALEYMSKYVQQSIGDVNNPPIKRYPDSGSQTGFQVRRDLNSPQTPSNLADDSWVSFSLSNNEITAQCAGPGCPFVSESLTKKISGSFVADTVMPETPPEGEGFYVRITDPGPNQGMAVDIGLKGRHSPAVAVSQDNPQVSMKTRLISSCSSAN